MIIITLDTTELLPGSQPVISVSTSTRGLFSPGVEDSQSTNSLAPFPSHNSNSQIHSLLILLSLSHLHYTGNLLYINLDILQVCVIIV